MGRPVVTLGFVTDIAILLVIVLVWLFRLVIGLFADSVSVQQITSSIRHGPDEAITYQKPRYRKPYRVRLRVTLQ